MFRTKNICTTSLGILAAMAMMLLASPAQAGITITISEGGVATPPTVVTTALNSLVFNGSYGDYTISLNAGVSNSPGSLGLATLNVGNAEFRGDALAGSTGDLTIKVEATGF